MGILEWLFQNGQLFPLAQEPDQKMGEQAEYIKRELERLTAVMDGEQAQRFQTYLEEVGRFHDMERQLCYENGFLFASMLWIEIWVHLGGPRM